MVLLTSQLQESTATRESHVAQAVATRAREPTDAPLVVDLDGTLLRTDSLFEALMIVARTKPLLLLHLLWALRHGVAYLKLQLTRIASLDASTLPYRSEVLTYLRAQKQHGRQLVLATGADRLLAQGVATELGIFDRVFASDGDTNLSGGHKRERLVAEFGVHGFDYVGNSQRDFPVWSAARKAIVVSSSQAFVDRVKTIAPVEKVFAGYHPTIIDYFYTIRLHHWVKNLLVFVPLAAAHRMFELNRLGHAALAFIAFSLCASSVYLLNDLLDLPADRLHPQKRERKLASGQIPIHHALVLQPMLLLGALLIGLQLPHGFLAVLAIYFISMLAYSFSLKNIALLDVLLLASGYAMRVAAGGYAVDIAPSSWLLAFCVFLFLSLALVKRYAELVIMKSVSEAAPRARGYFAGDEVVLIAQGITSGYLTVLVLALYTNTDIAQQLYQRHEFFWPICLLLLFWISYIWLAASRGRMHHDPVVFAITDRVSLIALIGMGFIALLAM